jgi:hypothetical protein
MRLLDKVVVTLCLKGGLCYDNAHIFHFQLLLFIMCTITVSHMTDASSFSHMTHYESFLGLYFPHDSS